MWNEGPSFTKPFDNVPPLAAPSVKNVRMRDNLGDPATDTDDATPELERATPVAIWETVPGAAEYQVTLRKKTGAGWDGSIGAGTETAAPGWTPLG